jgi:SPP1 family holin
MSKGTFFRTLALFVALVNQILVAYGYSPLPIEDGQIELIVSGIFTLITALISWWKNNSFTENAIIADIYLKGINEEKR